MPQESHGERVNRELIELLNELRVARPGVQVLFAFLLAVPFTQRFSRVTDLQKDTFMVVFLVTDLLFKATVTVVVTNLTAALFALVWFVLPLLRKAQD